MQLVSGIYVFPPHIVIIGITSPPQNDYCTLTVLPPRVLDSASRSAMIPSASTSAMSFCSIASCCSLVAPFMAAFAAWTRARYCLYLSSVPKILSHHLKEVEKLLVKAMWWKSWCSAPDQKGTML